MGAWGAGNFENDGALDWVIELEDEESLDLVFKTLERRGPDGEGGDEVLAAAEVVAALNGHPTPDLPEEIEEWIVDKPAPGNDVTHAALQAVEWVWSESELRELWEDSDHMPEWTSAIEDLRSRLKAPIVECELRPREMREPEDGLSDQRPIEQEGRPGDLIGIPLLDGRWGLGQILSLEADSNSLCVAVLFRQALASDDSSPDEPPGLDDVVSCESIDLDFLHFGKWRLLRRGCDLATAREAHSIALAAGMHAVPMSFTGAAVVEDFLNAFHALGPWNMYAGGPDAYDDWLLFPDRKPERRIYFAE